MQNPDLLNRRDVCAFFGGVDASTIYRWAKVGLVPKPVKVGMGSSRWLRSECEACLRQMTEAR
jgi:predicted DNA-binding transcriptional regulator AlpA